MKPSSLLAVLALTLCATRLSAEVSIAELEDRIQVKIDGRIFTEWRHQDWIGPYLYPVIGPNGENVTRHFPMKQGIPGETQDHPHHRSIRFSHSDVNGYNFWWAREKEPESAKSGHPAEVRLERVDRITSGETGEVVFYNQWLGDGTLVLREKVRLAFVPLENQQVLMDYDVVLHAGDTAVTFGDKRDGGLMVRVAGPMAVESGQGGAILNSRGDRNADAWGKRAEWVDYFGPDASGKTVGIAMFDHPANLRFPTHWHARTYGLITANRFGTDHFKGAYEDHKTVVCRPFGDSCPACASHSGDYTMAVGESLRLRHRLYFHHGDPTAAKVAEQYRAYTNDEASTLIRMRVLQNDRKWKELVEQFGEADFADGPVAALLLRGQAYSFTKDGARAEADFKAAVRIAPGNPDIRLGLADNYAIVLNDERQALEAYREALALSGTSKGWQPLSATVAIARILTNQVKPDSALEVLNQVGDLAGMAPVWRIKMLRAYGHAYAAQGKEEEALAKFREALALESSP
ncbi:MAG: DUF6807 family protein [Verrucomicrobiales bacterium]